MTYRSSSYDNFIFPELQVGVGPQIQVQSPIPRFINTTGGQHFKLWGHASFSVYSSNIGDTTFYGCVYSIAPLSADAIKKKRSLINVEYIRGIFNTMSHILSPCDHRSGDRL